MLPAVKPIDFPPKYNVDGGLVPRPPDWYYPETTTMCRMLRWHDKLWEIQDDRGLPLRQRQVKEAKAPPSAKSRVSHGQVLQRMQPDWDAYVMDFDSYAAHFPLSLNSKQNYPDVYQRMQNGTRPNKQQ